MPDKPIAALQARLGVTFSDLKLLTVALTHRSYLNEHPEAGREHNERMEFLGDAVLELVVTEHLYRSYPNPEGELTNWRASLVNAKMLSDIAVDWELEQYLYLSRGETKDANSKARRYILANAVESVIGAIYLDQGMPAAKALIERDILTHLPYILEHQLYLDPKSRFQEKAQELLGVTPNYKVLDESGPDHAKEFEIGVYIEEELIATGSGSSKQEAQVAAAQAALTKKGWE